MSGTRYTNGNGKTWKIGFFPSGWYSKSTISRGDKKNHKEIKKCPIDLKLCKIKNIKSFKKTKKPFFLMGISPLNLLCFS